MELLDIYQDILSTQVQTLGPVAPASNEFEEGVNDRASVRSLFNRLDAHSPPEPGTSQSHAIGADFRGPVSRYQLAISQVAAILEGNSVTEHLDPSSSQNTTKPILPSPLELAALVRECVSTSGYENTVHQFRFSRFA